MLWVPCAVTKENRFLKLHSPKGASVSNMIKTTQSVPWDGTSSRVVGRSHRTDTSLIVTRVGLCIKGFCFTTSWKIIHMRACVPQWIRGINSFKSLDDLLPDISDFSSKKNIIFIKIKRCSYLSLQTKYILQRSRNYTTTQFHKKICITRMDITNAFLCSKSIFFFSSLSLHTYPLFLEFIESQHMLCS